MINFRYHVVSLLAVFLALAVGITLGATVIREGVVDSLDQRISDVRKENDARRTENDGLRQENAQQRDFIDDLAASAVEERLAETTVAVVASRGTDAASTRALVTTLRTASASVPGVVWLEAAWRLENPADRTRLATLLAVDPTSSAAALRPIADAALVEALTGATAAAPSTDTTTTTTRAALTTTTLAGTQPPATTTTTVAAPNDLLTRLAAARFVSLDAIDGPAGAFDGLGAGTRLVLATPDPSTDWPAAVLHDLAAAADSAAVDVLAGEVWTAAVDGPDRGTVVQSIRRDDVLRDAVSTVDDLDLTEGRIAAVFALVDLAAGRVGHYGYGAGATRPLPQR